MSSYAGTTTNSLQQVLSICGLRLLDGDEPSFLGMSGCYTHKASLFNTRATLSDSAVRFDLASAKQLIDRQ